MIIDPFRMAFKMKEFEKFVDEGAIVSQSRTIQLEIDDLLNIRFSYRDFMLFLAIAKSVSKQERQLIRTVSGPIRNETICLLQEMGFESADCHKALLKFEGSVERAAYYLCEQQFHSFENKLTMAHLMFAAPNESVVAVNHSFSDVSICILYCFSYF